MNQLNFNTLKKLVDAASTVRDMAFERRTYHFKVTTPCALYLNTEYSHVQIIRHDAPEIIIETALQAGFGWRVQTDQDEAGVYIVAKRRVLVGEIASAQFTISLPQEVETILKLEHCALTLLNISTKLHLPGGIQTTIQHVEDNDETSSA